MASISARFKVTANTNVEEIKARFDAAYPHAQDAASEDVQNNIKSMLIPGHGMRTGILRDSIRETGRTLNTVFVGTSLWRAHFTEFGTHEHSVRPRNPRKALAWAGAAHPYRDVVVSGSPEVGFMRRGLEASRLTVGTAIANAFRERLERP